MIRNADYVMNRIADNLSLAKPAQVGVDLTVNKVFEISAEIRSAGMVQRNSTLIASQMERIWPETDLIFLEAGKAYAVEFDQGISLTSYETAFIIQRSSLNRNGCMLVGSVFDPGFHTETLGATLYAFSAVGIERHARLAQVIIMDSESVESKYEGQFQGKVGS